MPIKVFGYPPAWGLPDVSPYVTKLIFFLKMTNTPFEHVQQNLAELDTASPYGKLPYIVDEDGTKVGDSNQIIEYLDKKHGITLDKDLTPEDKAICLAFERLIGEHLYWSGIIEPRWRMDEGWEVYIPYLVQGAPVDAELRAMLDAFRTRILAGFDGQGMGRRPSSYVYEIYKTDVDAISDYLGSKKYFYGDKVHNVDAAAFAMLRHLMDQPQKWKGSGYVEGKQNLVDYVERMKSEYNV